MQNNKSMRAKNPSDVVTRRCFTSPIIRNINPFLNCFGAYRVISTPVGTFAKYDILMWGGRWSGPVIFFWVYLPLFFFCFLRLRFFCFHSLLFFFFYRFFSSLAFLCFFLFRVRIFLPRSHILVFRARVFFLFLLVCRWIARPSWCTGFNAWLKSLHLLFQIRESDSKNEKNAHTRKSRRWNEK